MNTLDGAGAVCLATDRPGAFGIKVDGHDRIADKSLRELLSSHLPNVDGTSCTECEFVYTPKLPLCPAVADALRVLSIADARPRTSTSPLARFTTSRLRTMASEHHGEGRCRRCGFVYSGQVRNCPTSRRIADELESRGKAPVTQSRAGRGLCAGKGAGWTVSGQAAEPWKRAMAACLLCPLLAQCEARLDSQLSAGEKIREQVIAGRLFTVTGQEIVPEKVDDYAFSRGRRKGKAKPAAPDPAPVPAVAQVARQLELFEVAA